MKLRELKRLLKDFPSQYDEHEVLVCYEKGGIKIQFPIEDLYKLISEDDGKLYIGYVE